MLLTADSVNLFQVVICKFLIDNIGELFGSARDVRDRFKIIWVFSVVVGNLFAIRPYTDRRTGGVAVRFQLLLPIAEPGLLELNDDVGYQRTVLIHDGNIGPFDLPAKMNREFNFNLACGIAVFVNQLVEIELTHGLLRL